MDIARGSPLPMSPNSNNRSRQFLSANSSRGSASFVPDSVFGLKGRRNSLHLSMNARDHDVFDDIPGRRGLKFDSLSSGRRHYRSSLPVHDKPVLDVYEDKDGYDDVLVLKKVRENRHLDDILAGFRIKDDDFKSREKISRFAVAAGYYARSVQPKGSPYTNTESIHSPQPTANADKQRGGTFEALGPSPSRCSTSFSGISADPLKGVNMSGKSKILKANGFSASSESIYDNWKDVDRNTKSMPSLVSVMYSMGNERIPLKSEHSTGRPTSSQPRAATSQLSAVNEKLSDDVWLTVSEIPLITQPTKGPPPSRPPPPLPAQVLRGKDEIFGLSKENKKFNGSLAGNPVLSAVKARVSSSFDQLRNLSMSRSSHVIEDLPSGFLREEPRRNSDAAAMKVAIDRVEAKFWHANESRGSEVPRSSRSRESKRLNKIECSNDSLGQVIYGKERYETEWTQRQIGAVGEREDNEQRRLEKENESSKQIERERQAVERVTREAHERAATEARLKAEKADIEKAHAEIRVRVERAAVQRAVTEARQRAANGARETAAKAAAEVRDREAFGKSYEAWLGTERAAAESKGRHADEVRQMATSSAAYFSKDNPATSENGLDPIFKKSSQASSASKTRENAMGAAFDSKPRSRQGPDVVKTPAPSFSSLRQIPSSASLADNLASILGVTPSGEFQEIEGEAEERRNARMERHQRTQERAAKALAEKNHRDMQIQRELEERHRIAETMDIEIKRWAAGKEGNLRALLSTLQYVLWPECGWQPVSLTDLINTESVRKAYRKATLCIHPDKMQQRGANLQQKYISEKIFDLLKEAWNKLNS